MMYKKYILQSFGIVIVAVLIGATVFRSHTTVASTSWGSEYQATSSAPVAGGVSYTSILNTGTGAFGSIVITGKGTGSIYIYDGTTTTQHNAWATTTLAVIPNNAPEGTYTFDVAYRQGLIVEYKNAAATTTITYR